ncbi:MAG: sulfatase [Planctomycetota bacterium]|jgi:arylsulfatase A-like enzyme
MNRRRFLKAVGFGAALMAVPGYCFSKKALSFDSCIKKKPNFVFVLIDDMGWKDLSCYGSTFYETPNIDKLAADGMKFTDAYAACPVCSPTRGSILLGKYPARTNLTDWLFNWRRGNLIPPEYLRALPFKDVTIAEALKKAGYTTLFVGKWHLGKKPSSPERHGFDVNIGGTKSGMAESHFYPEWKANIPIEAESGSYLADCLTDKSLELIEKNKDKPFFLYLSHYSVHTPLEAKEELTAEYEKKAAKLPPLKGPKFGRERWRDVRLAQDHAVYAGMVQSVDESVGRVVKKLEQLSLADNTVVIFMSDNGGLSTTENTPTSNIPLRAGKGWLYEGGVRVPMIIKWPGKAKPNSVCDESVISNDFYPTMLEMAELPLLKKQHCDGLSLVPLLLQKGRLNRQAIYWHYPHYASGPPSSAVRAGDYKLIEFYEEGIELYNLKNDIGEKHNLAEKMPEKAAELKKMLEDWKKTVGARLPKVDPNPDPKYQQAHRKKW